ncbi:ABC transporter ATP-binding protein [Vannielia litorea]|nr:dipeptide ABC transporter ATP-binding protein [Vannielia litorea]
MIPRTHSQEAAQEVLRVEDLEKHYPIRGGFLSRTDLAIQAVNGVSFSLRRGETLGIVGESGCGKSTVCRTVMKLTEPTGGRIFSMGHDITDLTRAQMRPHRRNLQMVFQDPMSSLNPRMTAEEIVAEPMQVHGTLRGAAARKRVAELLGKVGIARASLGKYPHEFSGGQRQRIAIARALALDPSVIVCDEAVSALDVSIQAQILNLFKELQQDLGLAYLFISHDLAVMEYLCDRVAVMYLGRIVEIAEVARIFSEPKHPYTRALLSSVPRPDPDHDRSGRVVLTGEVPSPIRPPSGCYFRTRCAHATAHCAEVPPPLRTMGPKEKVACHLHDPEARQKMLG